MESSRAADRLSSLPRGRVLGREIPVAVGFRARLLGIGWLPRELSGDGLLIPRCASVHTFGMRFDLDLVFLDQGGRPLAFHYAVSPRRLVWCRGADAVLEIPSVEGESLPPAIPWEGDVAAETRDRERRRL
ncbi:MAG: hypothetical protein WD810_05260 [Solirubrobacterales bacterium]